MEHYSAKSERDGLGKYNYFCTMKHMKPIPNQDYITFSGEDLIIIDKIQNMPENSAYYSDYVLVLICTRGKIQLMYDNHPVTVHEDELFFALPNSVISDYMLSPNFDCKLLSIRPSETTTSHDLHSMIVNSMIYVKSHPVTKLNNADKKNIFNYYNLLCSSIQQSTHRYHYGEVRALVNAFILNILGVMDRDMQTPETSTTVHGAQIVEKFVWMVNQDGGRNRFVGYYADQLNITPKYLSSLARASLGRTPTEVIQMVTMKEIERRLRYGDESIKEISNTMNFPNTSFFGKYFKQHSGMTPNGYRKKYHK